MKKASLIIIGFLIPFAGEAQLTLQECRNLARDHYPEISRYALIEQTEQYNLSNAGKIWLPQMQLSAQATWQNEVMELPSALSSVVAAQGISYSGMRKDQYKVNLQINQTIWDGGQSAAQKECIKGETAVATAQSDVTLYSLTERVDNLFFSILLFDEQLKQNDLTTSQLQVSLERVQSMVKNGTALQGDADAIEAEILTLGQNRLTIESARANYVKMLELFIGKEVTESLEKPEATELLSTENRRPELTLFSARKSLLESQEKSILAQTMPTVGAFATGYYGYPGLNAFKSMTSSEWSFNAIVGVSVSWNISSFYTKQNNLKKLNAQARQVDVDRDIFLFNNNLQYVKYQGDVETYRNLLAEDDKIIKLRESVRNAAESKLKNGIVDTSDLIIKTADENKARRNRVIHEIEMLQSMYNLKQTINQ